MEEWKQIQDYPNYSISSFGNVRNDITNKILKPIFANRYYRISLCNGIKKQYPIHRLVGGAFINNPENKLCIDHIDNNRCNNNVNNLRWATIQENSRNTRKKDNKTSVYKGVHLQSNDRWRSIIYINKKQINIGSFKTEKEAGLAYNKYIQDNSLDYFVLNEIN